MTATAPPPYTPPAVTAKQQFIDAWTRENATTRRVIMAFADGLGEFTPHERCRSAREVAYIFARSQTRIAAALNNAWQWPPPPFPPVPTSYADVIAAFDQTTEAVRTALANVPDSRMTETITFLTGPKQFGEIPVVQLVWFMLMDAIHHRGQLTVYLRAAGAKVPSIYGPTADEPWTRRAAGGDRRALHEVGPRRSRHEERMRGRRTLLMGTIIAAGCSDVLSPAEYIGVYALTRVDGDPLPAFVFDNGAVSAVVVADTIRIRSDGTGSRTGVRVYTNVTPHLAITSPTVIAATSEFTYKVVRNRLEITTICGPHANCAPPPHVIAIRTSSGLNVTHEGITRVPQEYAALGAR